MAKKSSRQGHRRRKKSTLRKEHKRRSSTSPPSVAPRAKPDVELHVNHVVPAVNVDLGSAESVRTGDRDIVVLIATTDEFDYIRDLVPNLAEKDSDVYRETGHCEYRFVHKAPNGDEYSLQVIVLGGQGELLASSVMMNTLYHRTTKPLLVASLGISMTLSEDVKLGDVVFASSIDRYLERARVEDVIVQKGVEPTDYELLFSGEAQLPLAEEVGYLKHFIHKEEHRKAYEKWQGECSLDARTFMGDAAFSSACREKMRREPKQDVGFILSGPLMVDSKVFKAMLTKSIGRTAKALDMESGGIGTCTKWIKIQQRPKLSLIIRGASDLGDGTKKRDDKGEPDPSAGSNDPKVPGTSYRRAAMRNAYRALLMLCDSGWVEKPC
jgi:nucleoside phosphorylase